MHRLSLKLGGALLLIVLVSVGLMAFLTNLNTTSEFSQYVQAGNQLYIQRIAGELSAFYAQENSWTGVQSLIKELRRSTDDRIILTDVSDLIVGDTAGVLTGKSAQEAGLSDGAPIAVAGKETGRLYLFVSSQPGMGMGMHGRMGSGGIGIVMLDSAQEQLVNRIKNYLWIAGLITLTAAFLLGLIVTRQITRPVYALNEGASHIAGGELSYRVPVKSKDELGNLARSFNRMATSLEKNEESRRALFADIAHELRTPLTVIEGTVTAIDDGVFAPDKEHLESIKAQTALLTRLVCDLRDLSLGDSGQLRLKPVPVELPEFLRRKLAQFEAKAREKNITLELKSGPNLPLVSIDPFRIDQVMTNLLANALRYTPENGSITVSLDKFTRDTAHHVAGPGLVVSVADTGEGIPPESLPHMFERFYRIESSRSRNDGGAGLGLAIVKQNVLAHNGAVWVESEVGKGSTFYFALPIKTEKR
jgi:signal transduction histidine kinase